MRVNTFSFTVLLIIGIFGIFNAEQCLEEDDASQSAEERVKNKLLCNYDREGRPVKDHNTPIQVQMDLNFKHIETDGEMQYANDVMVHSWISLGWMDEHLVWNTSLYDDVDMIRIRSDNIWIPEILLYNSDTNPVPQARAFSTDCMVFQTGELQCVAHVSHSASCDANPTKWPFDSRNCTMVFKTEDRGESVNISYTWENPEYVLAMYKENRHWHLENLNVSRDQGGNTNFTYPALIYNFLLRRHSGTYVAMLTAPALVMIGLTVTSMLLKVTKSERIYLLAVNLLSHFQYLEHLTSYVPSSGDKCPLVVLFYRDSMVLTATVLITTALLKMLMAQSSTVPKWVDQIIAVSNSTGGKILMYSAEIDSDLYKGSSENANEMKEKQRNIMDWRNFVIIVNRLLFLGTSLTYIGLFIAMIL